MRSLFAIFIYMVIGTSSVFIGNAQEAGHYTKLKKAKKNPDDVISLDLSYQRITKFPEEIKTFKNLETLNLSNNFFDEIPEWIDTLSNLHYLKLSSCSIDTLPSEIGGLWSLTELDISVNKLIRLDFDVTRLENLQILNVSHNALDTLPDFSSLQKLHTLLINVNMLKALPVNIEYTVGLQTLRMGHNPYLDIDEDLSRLSAAKNLSHLQVTQLGLGRIPEPIFRITNLKFLSLIYNSIDTLDAEPFRSLNKLEQLWLYDHEPLLSFEDIQPLLKVLPRKCKVVYQ